MTTMINGYKWSKGNSSSIADPSSSPASHLKKYEASVGEMVALSFAKRTKSPKLI
jgi:hypothetical protein